MGPFILAMLLVPMAESNMRRALAVSQGSYEIFYTRPITLILLIGTVISLALPIIKMIVIYKYL